MPKDIAHVTIAKKVFENLPKNSVFGSAAERYYYLFLYGSVVPDIPFYYVAGPHSAFVQSISDPLHGTDAKSIYPVLRFLEKREPDRIALAAGILCHIMTDTFFHPLVYYMAGMDGIHPGATARHRYFETILDYHFWSQWKDGQRLFLHDIRRNLEISGFRLNHLFETFFDIKKDPRKSYFHLAVRLHALSQTLFMNPVLKGMSSFLWERKIGIRDEDAALFYPTPRPVVIDFFKNPIRYKDPCMGTNHEKTVDRLVSDIVETMVFLLGFLEKAYSNGLCPADILADTALPSIRPCLPTDRASFLYWSGLSCLTPLFFKNKAQNCI